MSNIPQMIKCQELLRKFIKREKNIKKLRFWRMKLQEINKALGLAEDIPAIRDWKAWYKDPKIIKYEIEEEE